MLVPAGAGVEFDDESCFCLLSFWRLRPDARLYHPDDLGCGYQFFYFTGVVRMILAGGFEECGFWITLGVHTRSWKQTDRNNGA